MAMKKLSGKVLVNRHVFISRIKTRWSLWVWLVAAFLGVLIYFHGGQFGGMEGSVFTQMNRSAPRDTGCLEVLLVEVGDSVKKGDLLAQMDTSVLEAEKALVEAQMRTQNAAVKSEEVQNLRRFDAAIIRIESERRDLRLKQREGEGELAALRPEFKRLEKLLASKLIDEQELMPLRMKIRTLESAAQSYSVTLVQIEASLAEAQKQKKSIEIQSATAIELIDAEAKMELHLLDLQIAACSLRAREDSVVSRIYHYPGNMVEGGDTILASVVSGESRVIGFLSEYNARDVEVGMQAYLTSVSGYGSVSTAKVLALTPEIFSLPGRASPSIGLGARGRRVILEIEGDSGLLPGESVEIHFSRPWTSRLFWTLFGQKEKGQE